MHKLIKTIDFQKSQKSSFSFQFWMKLPKNSFAESIYISNHIVLLGYAFEEIWKVISVFFRTSSLIIKKSQNPPVLGCIL